MLGRDARARVDHVQRHLAVLAARADEHAAALRVAQRIGDQVLQDPLQQRGVRVNGERRRHDVQAEAARRRMRRELRRQPREQRRQRDAPAFGGERVRLEARQVQQLRELRLERRGGALDAGNQRREFRRAPARRQRRREQRQRMQRLAQVVARRSEQLALRAVGRFRRCTRALRRARLVLGLRDQVHVRVADRERVRQHVVQVMAERDNEQQHDEHHDRRVQVHGTAFECDAHDQRQQRRQHEAVERRLVHGGEVEPAEHHAEQAHDQQRLVRWRRRREQHHRRHAPQRTRQRGAERPVAAPAWRRVATRLQALPCARERCAPRLVHEHQREPDCHRQPRHLVPERAPQDQRAEHHGQRRLVPALVEHRHFVGAGARDQGGRQGGERTHGNFMATSRRRPSPRRISCAACRPRRRAARARPPPACGCAR